MQRKVLRVAVLLGAWLFSSCGLPYTTLVRNWGKAIAAIIKSIKDKKEDKND